MRPVGIAAVSLCLASCTDMTAVTNISNQLTSASSTWSDVGNEFIMSCQRERQINSQLIDCSIPQQASDGLSKLNSVLAGYFVALGDAANNSNFTIQPGLTDLTNSVTNIPGINQAQVTAASGLFAFLVKWQQEKLREATVRDLIDKGAPPAHELIGALDSLVVSNLTQELTGEHTALAGKFGPYILAQGQAISDPRNLDAICVPGATAGYTGGAPFLLAEEYCTRVKIINARLKALNDYKESLTAANNALTDLESNKIHLKGKALLNQWFNIGSDLHSNIVNVSKAFS